jgi:hypothetical protein
MKGEIKILIAMALAASSAFADAQTVTTQETVTRSVTITTPMNLEGSSGCAAVGRVVGLDPQGDNFLSVRKRPHGSSGSAYEVDQLFTNDRVCIVGSDGRWLNVRYERKGRMFSGWVYDRYIAED